MLRRSLAWWVEGLWLGLPPSWRKRWFPPRPKVVLHLASDLSRCEYREAGDGDDAGVSLAFGDIASIGTLHRDSIELTVVIDRSEGLIKTFSVPAAAERELRQLLRHEIDRTTPFDCDDIHFDYEVDGTGAETGNLRVRVGIVRRDYLDVVREKLKGAGLRPHRITTVSSDGSLLRINWLGDSAPIRLPFAGFPLQPAIVGLLLVSLFTALYAGAARLERLDQRYAADADAARTRAVGEQTAVNLTAAAASRANYFNDLESTYISPVDILAELSDALPDTAWISRFGIAGGSVQLQGEATGASGLLEIVASLPTLDFAEFQSPVTLNEGTRKESFSILASLATSEESK
jgi:general secretion pathway protein L